MLRFARDGRPKPIMGKGAKPEVYQTELDAQKAITKALLTYFNGNLVRDGETLQAGGSARQNAESVFRGLSKPALKVERRAIA